MSPLRRPSLGTLLPFALFLLFVVALVIGLSLSFRPPVVASVSPEFANPGEALTIYGRNFGDRRLRSSVVIGSVRPSAGDYLSWGDREIRVRVPEAAASGLLFVETEYGRSEGILFTNRRRQAEEGGASASPGVGAPVVDSISPDAATVGSRITIRGRYFGELQRDGFVDFVWGYPEDDVVLPRVPGYTRTHADRPIYYEFWSDREIRLRIPDGAVAGPVRVTTARGVGVPRDYEIIEQVGTKVYGDRVSYTLSHGFAVAYDPGPSPLEEQATIDVWLPLPSKVPEQRNVQTIRRSIEALFSDYLGAALYSLPAGDRSERRVVTLDRYSVRVTVLPERVRSAYDTGSAIFRRYTAPEAGLFVEQAGVVAIARRELGRNANPYLRARAIYDTVRSALVPGARAGSAEATLAAGAGDASDYAALVVSVLRSSGIPARVVSGVRVVGERNLERHAWAEFYLADLGWVPMDPYLADLQGGDNPDDRPLFGELDNRRISFSHGRIDLRPADTRLPRVAPADAADVAENVVYALPEAYSSQTLYAELVGGGDFALQWYPVQLLGVFPGPVQTDAPATESPGAG